MAKLTMIIHVLCFLIFARDVRALSVAEILFSAVNDKLDSLTASFNTKFEKINNRLDRLENVGGDTPTVDIVVEKFINSEIMKVKHGLMKAVAAEKINTRNLVRENEERFGEFKMSIMNIVLQMNETIQDLNETVVENMRHCDTEADLSTSDQDSCSTPEKDQAQVCKEISPFYGGDVVYQRRRSEHSLAVFICADGYTLYPEGTTQSTCRGSRNDGSEQKLEWSPKPPTCHKKLPVVEPANCFTRSSKTEITHMQRYYLYPRSGYEFYSSQDYLAVSSLKINNHNGTFNPPLPQCVPARCSTWRLDNMRVHYSNMTQVSGRIESHTDYIMACTDNHELKGHGARGITQLVGRCEYGEFMNVLQCVPSSCKIPDDMDRRLTMYQKPNRVQVYLSAGEEVDHGSYVFFDCSNTTEHEQKYEPVNRRFQCMLGEWIEADRKPNWNLGYNGSFPQCRQAICDPPCQHDGVCFKDGECRCENMTMGDRCETLLCDASCTSNGGECVLPGICGNCPDTRRGDNCEIETPTVEYTIVMKAADIAYTGSNKYVYVSLHGHGGITQRFRTSFDRRWGVQQTYLGIDVRPIQKIVIEKETEATESSLYIVYVYIYTHDTHYVFGNRAHVRVKAGTPTSLFISGHPERCVHTFERDWGSQQNVPYTVIGPADPKGCMQLCVTAQTYSCKGIRYVSRYPRTGGCDHYKDSSDSSNHFTKFTRVRNVMSYKRICRQP